VNPIESQVSEEEDKKGNPAAEPGFFRLQRSRNAPPPVQLVCAHLLLSWQQNQRDPLPSFTSHTVVPEP
jgi:hypothetical protein